MTTSGNGSPAISNTLMVEPAAPTFSATSVVLGANATYTLSDASWPALSSAANAVVLTAKASAGTTHSWYSALRLHRGLHAAQRKAHPRSRADCPGEQHHQQ